MIENFKNIIDQMLFLSWPMVVISIIIIVSLRVTDIIIKKEKIVLYQELLKLSFIIYILFLFQIVSDADPVSASSTNFIPFKEIFRYNFGSYLFYKNILGNMLLFMPFGLFIGYFLKIKKIYVVVILSFIASLAIESTQLSIGRVFDIDDIILNILGGSIGFSIYYLTNKFYDIIPDKLKKDWIINILVIIFIILIVRFIVL